MNRFIALTAALLLTVMTSACNTVEGAGKDIQHAGSKLEGEAVEHK